MTSTSRTGVPPERYPEKGPTLRNILAVWFVLGSSCLAFWGLAILWGGRALEFW